MPASTIVPKANTNLNAIPGESVAQYEARMGQLNAGAGTGFGTPVPARPVTDVSSANDEVAKNLGFNSYNDAVTKLTAPPDDTTKFYNDAYNAAGLDALAARIAQRQSELTQAAGNINDNPWLSEASRVGRVKNLSDMANTDIKNYQGEYDTKLKSVHDLVTQHSQDLQTSAGANKAKLAALEAQANALAAEAADKAKASATPPKTIKAADGTTYKFNPATGSFDVLFSGKTTQPTTKEFSFTPKQLTALQSMGLGQDDATGILADIKAGHDLESIRQQMKASGLDPGLLDTVMYYVDPAHNTPKKTAPTSSSGRSA